MAESCLQGGWVLTPPPWSSQVPRPCGFARAVPGTGRGADTVCMSGSPRVPGAPQPARATSAAFARKECVWFAFRGDFQHSEGEQAISAPGTAAGAAETGGFRWGSGKQGARAQALCRHRERGVPTPARGLAPRSHSRQSQGGVGVRRGVGWGRPGRGPGVGQGAASAPAPSQMKPPPRRTSSRPDQELGLEGALGAARAKPTLSEAAAGILLWPADLPPNSEKSSRPGFGAYPALRGVQALSL